MKQFITSEQAYEIARVAIRTARVSYIPQQINVSYRDGKIVAWFAFDFPYDESNLAVAFMTQLPQGKCGVVGIRHELLQSVDYKRAFFHPTMRTSGDAFVLNPDTLEYEYDPTNSVTCRPIGQAAYDAIV